MASLRPREIAAFIVYFISVVFVHLSMTISCSSAWNIDNCSTFCKCYWRYGLKWADCANQRLYSVQTGVDEQSVQALDLYNNSISSLANYELRDAGLTRLKLLNLSYNTIREIGLKAFVDLSQLRVLDLSRNHLYSILPDTFVKNNVLEVLDLAGNNFNTHNPTLRSSSLGSLDLSDCGISHLPSNTFDGLPRLRALDLTDNMMIQLEPSILNGLPNLVILLLERNPWSCNGVMYELQKRLQTRKIIFKKVCNEASEPMITAKKFEKMIAVEKKPSTADDKRTSGRLLVEVKNWQNSIKPNNAPNRSKPNVSSNIIVREKTFAASFTNFSSYLFLAFGFILGSAVSTVITYLWLTRSFSRSLFDYQRSETRRESPDVVSQRVNLVQYLWDNNDDTSRSTSDCPGTPPPPYRDVILHSSRYPRSNVQSSLIIRNERNDQCD